jgi:NAD(P)-dependent dehydrogenase (short-subunit alcohol dehydrogenase family)
VVICELDETKGKAKAAELGDRAVFVKTDVTSEESVQMAIAQGTKLGPVRIGVIAHGGGGAPRTLDRDNNPAPQQDYDRVVNIFLSATYNVVRLMASAIAKTDALDEGERGVIIQTASIAGYDGTIGQAAYAAAKGGVIGMTLPLARDLAPMGVRVLTIAPGTFLTPAFGEMNDEQKEQLDQMWGAAVQFPKRMGRAGEYAQLAQQMVENIYLNGEVVRIDGALRFAPKGAK